MRLFVFGVLVFIGFSFPVLAQPPDSVDWAPVPESVSLRPLDLTKRHRDELKHGRQFLNIETHVNMLGDRPRQTFRWAIKAYSAKAIEEVASPVLSIETNYLEFQFHYVHVIRNGEIVYDENDIKMNFYRQQASDQSVDGLEYLTVQMIIPGVRSGDIVDYSFSTIGYNPAFKGRIFNNFAAAYDFDVESIYHQYTTSMDRPIDVRLFAGLEVPEIREGDGVRHYIWERKNVKAVELEQGTPPWHHQIPNAVLSEFQNWADVVDYLLPLTKLDSESAEAVAELADELARRRRNPTEEDHLRQSLSYVQSEIRYLGSQIGRNGYIPEPPEKVLQSGYGDCKDNSQLLIALLRNKELTAWPALVSSRGRNMAGFQGPTPFAFDHMIVYVVADGKEYWVDPAVGLNAQRTSSLEAAAHYGEALVIRPGETGLRKIDPENKVFLSSLEAVDYFDLSKAAGRPGTITLERSYRGLLADSMRATIEQSGKENYAKYLLKNRQRQFEDIDVEDPLEVNLDFVEKRVDTIEYYDIADPWTLGASDRWYFAPRAHAFDSFGFAKPVEDRRTPLQLVFPERRKQTLAFHIPDWPFKKVDFKIERPYHRFWVEQEYKNYALHVTYVYETLMDHVPADQVNEYLDDLKKIYGRVKYWVFYPKQNISDTDIGEFEAPPMDLDAQGMELSLGGSETKAEDPE